jgi:U4/U6.U5 tri-snRNP-associated protein 1
LTTTRQLRFIPPPVLP